MTNLIWACRYLLLGVFIVSNAIICSVAVWNFFIAQEINHNLQIDAFLIAVSAVSLLFALFIIICGLVRRNSVVARVWFECVWVGVLYAMQFSGAVAITSILPSLMCPATVVFELTGSCASTQVLMAFTWICSIVLLAYFLLLFISAVVFAKTDPRIWSRAVRHFNLSDVPDSASPLAPDTHKRWSLKSIVAPRPRRPAPSALYAFSGGFGSNPDEDIEASQLRRKSSHRPAPPVPTTPAPQYMVQRARSAGVTQVSSFYPQHVQTAMAEASSNANTVRPLARVQASPPPLGDWPRADALLQPLRNKSKGKGKARMSSRGSNADTTSSTHATRVVRALPSPSTTPPSVPPAALTHPARPRPSGPRTRRNSRDGSRPPPLDLSNISSYGERRRGS